MKLSRRHFSQLLGTGLLASPYTSLCAQLSAATPWHESIAYRARELADRGPVQLLIPHGSAANVYAGTDAFSAISGVSCVINEVPVDEMNVELILRANTGDDTIDVALPATFGLPDLVEAQAIEPLDEWAKRYEPQDFSEGHLYRNGDFYQGRLYGYQADGDAYLLFYNKRLLENPSEQLAYAKLTGRTLGVARTWEDLDAMMDFFHRPEENLYGGCLFRNPGYLVWEWWARFHAKGYFPVADDMTPNINNAAGVAALDELIAASAHQSPAARSNGLFENWEDFSTGNIFCNIGWGGTQKYLMGSEKMRSNLVHAPLPGVAANGKTSTMGYFNWGWNYTVSANSTRKELAYLLTLFCSSPVISTLSVREREGYFDPCRLAHYDDPDIQSVYGSAFLDAHYKSLSHCIPDFYLSGQGNYMDALRQHILNALNGEISTQEALDRSAKQWNHLTRRLGVPQQSAQWLALKATYPSPLRDILRAR